MFLDFLLSQNIVTELQYNKVLAEVDTKFDGNITQALISAGVSEDSITQAKASFYKLPYQKVLARQVSYDIVKYIPEDAARHYKFIPIAFSDGVLSIGVTEPENIEGMNALQFISVKLGIPFKVFLISYSDFVSVADNYKAVSQEVNNAIGELNTELEQELVLANKKNVKNETGAGKPQVSDQEKIVEDAPIIKIVAVIINHAVEGNASDIHIEIGRAHV